MTKSPYAGKLEKSWATVTQRLVHKHPLKLPELRDTAVAAWGTLWKSTVGAGASSIRLSELKVPATIVGYFFEVLLARELETRHPELWRGSRSKDEKDLVFLPDPTLSVEIKASGQAGFKVYGNRSYGQTPERESLVKKEKSGYYVTVNFYEQNLTLLRFGWIDAEDWEPQKAATGQMAGLKPAVYKYKLISISGAYRQSAPVILLDGVGRKTADAFARLGIQTIGELLAYSDQLPPRLERIKVFNKEFLAGCYEQS
jgi:hypothetical protein